MKIIRDNWKVILAFMTVTVIVSLPGDWIVQVNETLGLIYFLVVIAGAVYAGILFNIRVHKQKGDA